MTDQESQVDIPLNRPDQNENPLGRAGPLPHLLWTRPQQTVQYAGLVNLPSPSPTFAVGHCCNSSSTPNQQQPPHNVHHQDAVADPFDAGMGLGIAARAAATACDGARSTRRERPHQTGRDLQLYIFHRQWSVVAHSQRHQVLLHFPEPLDQRTTSERVPQTRSVVRHHHVLHQQGIPAVAQEPGRLIGGREDR